jgi:hypothetical protein
MSTQDANGIGAQDSRHPAISVPEYTAPYRIPNWNPAKRTVLPAEKWFY